MNFRRLRRHSETYCRIHGICIRFFRLLFPWMLLLLALAIWRTNHWVSLRLVAWGRGGNTSLSYHLYPFLFITSFLHSLFKLLNCSIIFNGSLLGGTIARLGVHFWFEGQLVFVLFIFIVFFSLVCFQDLLLWFRESIELLKSFWLRLRRSILFLFFIKILCYLSNWSRCASLRSWQNSRNFRSGTNQI